MASNNMSPLRNFLNNIKNSVYNISIDGIGNTDIDASNLFNSFLNLYRAITLNDMNYVTNMSSMFNNTRKLSQIPNYNFNTSNVVDMSYMFSYCYNLVNIPNFNTINVTNMGSMFASCHNLVNIPNFNTINVTNMGSMFAGCWNLTNIPNFNTINVTNMSWMFHSCYNLTTIPNLNTSNVTNMSSMFNGCWDLTNIPNFNTSNVTNMREMFSGCNKLSQASVNNIVASCANATKVTNKSFLNIGLRDAILSDYILSAPRYDAAVANGWVL